MSLQFLTTQFNKLVSVCVLFLVFVSFFNLATVNVFAVDPPLPPAPALKPATAPTTPPKEATAPKDTTPAKPVATETKNKDNGVPFNELNTGFKSEIDPRIGGLKACSTSNAMEKADVGVANKFLADCIKSIIQLVVGISVILAIMNMVWLGIQSLNSFGDQSGINKALSERITGFVIGALILGLFASIIGTINPAALNINNIFSKSIVEDIRNTVNNASLFGSGGSDSKANPTEGGNSTNGAGATGSSGDGSAPSKSQIDDEIKKIKTSGTNEQKIKLNSDLISCFKSYFYDSNVNCDKYRNASQELLLQEVGQLQRILPSAFATTPNKKEVKLNTDFENINVDQSGAGNAEIIIYDSNVNPKKTKITFTLSEKCTSTALKRGASNASIQKGQVLLADEGCSISNIKY